MVGALMFGVVGYRLLFPDITFEKILFMTGITLSTVGYGDILNVESSTPAIYFTMVLMVIGMGAVLYSISNVTAFIVEGNIRNIFARESMLRRAKRMKNHYIICGAGKTGIHIINEMRDTSQQFVVIESSQERIQAIREIAPESVIIEGDATDDSVFEMANLSNAKGLLATLSSDKDNLYLCLSAKMNNPNLKIVARTYDMKMYDKFKRAGADYIVSPNFIGGMRMASEILRPHVVTFLDKMLRAHDHSIRLEESRIEVQSQHIGKTFSEAMLYEKAGVNVLAYSLNGDEYIYNFSPTYRIQGGEIILYIGNAEQKKIIEDIVTR